MTKDSRNSDFMSGLTEAARANPVAAALIGGGALWLLIGNQRLKDMASAVAGTARPPADIDVPDVRTKAASLSERASDASDAIAETGRSAGQTIRDGAGSALSTVKDGIADTVGHAGDAIRAVPNPIPALAESYGQAQSALSDLLERQPLVLGAVGLAIGAAVAGAVPITSPENEWAGPTSDEVKSEIMSRASAVSENARESISTLGSETRGIAEETMDRVVRTGREAAAAAREKAGAAIS
jgi:hypothetical protein